MAEELLLEYFPAMQDEFLQYVTGMSVYHENIYFCSPYEKASI